MQTAEEKKSSGPKPIRNHQQRLENIVKQTTVETRVRSENTHIHTHTEGFIFDSLVKQTIVVCFLS